MPTRIVILCTDWRIRIALAPLLPGVLVFILPWLPRSAWSQVDVHTAAETLDTFRPYVRADYGYDSNLFRLENDEQARALLGNSDQSESYYTLAAGIDVDWRIQRQIISARLEVNQTDFDTYKQLDYSGYNGTLQWNWLVGRYAGGNLGVNETKTLASFTDLQSPTQNLLVTRQTYADAGIKLSVPWQLNLGFVRSTADNSANSRQVLNYNENKYSVGIQYQTAKGTHWELNSQYRAGQYPNRQIVLAAPIDNDYRQYDNGVLVRWSPTVKTQVKSQLYSTQRRYDEVPQRDFSGVTGQLAVDWTATEKTNLGVLFYRDIGVVENNTASYSVNRGLRVSADWRPTVKLSFTARAGREDQNYAGDPGFVLASAPPRQDTLTNYQLEAGYKVLRKIRLALLLQRGVRRSNQALAGYRFNSVLLNLRSEF